MLNNRGGAWGEDGRIVFSPDREAASLWQVSSSGGEPDPLIALGEGETTQRWPQMLRGGKAVLFTGNSRPGRLSRRQRRCPGVAEWTPQGPGARRLFRPLSGKRTPGRM